MQFLESVCQHTVGRFFTVESPSGCCEFLSGSLLHEVFHATMIFLIGLIVIVIGTTIAVVRSEKPIKHIFAEAKFEMIYNYIGSRSIFEDFIMRGRNKTKLEKKSGKVVLITGGTRGIGTEVIKMLMQCDMHVVMGCRSVESGEKVLKEIREDVKLGELKIFQLDISSLKSVRNFADKITSVYTQIDCLVNNAGIMYVPYAESEEGYESQFATNYLGHFLLTHLLLGLVKKAGRDGENARVVNVVSCAYLTGDIDFEDINKKNMFIPFEAYSQSKLAQVLFTNYLNETLKEKGNYVQVHSVHPGIVNTDLFDGTYVKTFFWWILPYIFKSPKRGAQSIVHACLSSDLEGKGATYISNCTVKPQIEKALDKELQKKLFDFTKKLVNVENFGT